MEQYQSYLIVHDVAKKKNVGTILRSCAAFGVAEIWLVGIKKLSTFGHQGTAKRLVYRFLPTMAAAKEHAVAHAIQICGIEIMSESRNLWASPFSGSTAFLLGNEGHGLTEAEKAFCDFFVYIPQYASNTESLNVAVAGSIVLSHFARK